MNIIFSKKLLSFFTSVLIPLLIVKLLWSISLFFFDKRSVEFIKEKDYHYVYNADIAKNILSASYKPKPKKVEGPVLKLTSLTLKATFVNGKNSFIVIEDGKDTIFLNQGEKYKEYTLIEVYKDRAVFEKDSKRFEIVIKENLPKSILEEEPEEMEEELPDFIPSSSKPLGNSVEKKVSRNIIERYIKNPKMIWKNISINEIRKNGVLRGFRVGKVKKGSYFERLGLRSGDIIKAIDGRPLRSIAQVMEYYKNISKINALTLTVERAGEEIDLFFDIN